MLSRTVDAGLVTQLKDAAERERRPEGRILDDALRAYFALAPGAPFDPLAAWLATLAPGHTGTAAEWLPAWLAWAQAQGAMGSCGVAVHLGRALSAQPRAVSWSVNRKNRRVYTVRAGGAGAAGVGSRILGPPSGFEREP